MLKRAVINRISGDYTLMSWASEVALWTFILAPAEDWWVGLRPITLAFGPLTIQFLDDPGRLQGIYHEIFMLI